MKQLGNGVITNNRFNFGATNVVCPPNTAIESIVLELGPDKDFTFSGNALQGSAQSNSPSLDALEIKNDTSPQPRATAGDNGFSNQNTGFFMNAIKYTGTYATGSQPLVAIGNSYNAYVTPPDPTNPAIIIGTDQYLTVTANNTQPNGSTRYIPVSGFTPTFGTVAGGVAQSWAQTGVFTAPSTNCGRLTIPPAAGNTYTFTLLVNGAAVSVTCTFISSLFFGVGSGSATIAAGQTIAWQAVQSAMSGASNPTINLVFARQQ